MIHTFLYFSFFLSAIPDSNRIISDNDSLPINQIQFLGSHNSYRKKTYQPLWDELHRLKHPFTKSLVVQPWNYTHASLDSQLTVYGLRSFEFDLYNDPEGGRFYYRKGNKKIKQETESNIEDLKKPGMKVMHVPDYDYETHHFLFTDVLQELKNWSDNNPEHEPLFVMVELKELQFMKYLFPRNCSKVLKFSGPALDSVDKEIESVFGKNSQQVFTPDELRGNYATLNEAVLKNGWPTLKSSRGKLFFILMAEDETINKYLENHESLKGRTMFIFSEEGKPESAFIKIGNPKKQRGEITGLVKKGYIVRTRSDVPTKDAHRKSYKKSEAAFESGAQIISTDYYAGDKCYLDKDACSDFKIMMPGGKIIRRNPVWFELKN
jgi:hypothetical protein